MKSNITSAANDRAAYQGNIVLTKTHRRQYRQLANRNEQQHPCAGLLWQR